jgi:hypothetical protein
VIALLAYATGYQALLALGVIGYGERGQLPPGWDAWLLSLAAMVATGAICLAVAVWPRAAPGADFASALRRSRFPLLIALLGLALVVVRYYAPDPALLNTDGRIADGSTMSGVRIVAAIALSLVAAIATRVSPRAGSTLVAFALWFDAATLTHEGYGH